MAHREYKNIVENAQKAVLFIHGIVGTPNHFGAFLPYVPQSITVWNMLLDGHGKGVRDFSETSMKKWEDQVRAAVAELSATHREIYIVGHSLGSLLAIGEACQNEKIRGLFLMAVPLKLFVKPKMLVNACKVGFDKVKEDDLVAVAARNCCGVAPDKNIFHYVGWIPRYLELFRKIEETRKLLPSLTVPCVAFQSAKDEMVSIRSAQLLQSNPAITVTELKYAGHYYYPQEDLELLLKSFAHWAWDIGRNDEQH